MKILHVIPGLSNASGPTQVVYHLAHKAIAQGHEVTICYIQGRGTDPVYDFDQQIILKGFSAPYLKKWGYSPALQRYLQREISHFDIVHVHSLWLYPNIAVAQAARRHNVPYIIRPAGSLEPWALGFAAWKKWAYLALIEKRIINRASRIHAVSEQEAENIKKLGFKPNVMIIPNGIEVKSFQLPHDKQEFRVTLNLPEDKFILLFLGRIHPVKNLEFLIEVMQRLTEQCENIMLVIAGPDQHPYAQEIKEKVRQAGIEFCCRFLGEVNAEEKINVYLAGDLFLLSSFSENFAVAVTEALASGLPVVVSERTPWAEVTNYQSGYWLPLDVSLFVEKIVLLSQNESLREKMSQRAKIHAQQYEWETISHKMISCYQQILNERSSRSQFEKTHA